MQHSAKRKSRRRWVRGLAIAIALLVFVAIALLHHLPTLLDRRFNPVRQLPPYEVTAAAIKLHQQLQIADLHADPLLWKRDLLKRQDRGQVDLPRLIAGNVALQVFGVVTQIPEGLNLEQNAAEPDRLTKLVVLQRWPFRTWGSILQRALYQAKKLRRFGARSQGQLQLIASVRDLNRLMAERANQSPLVGAMLGLEGVHALEGKLDNLDRLYQAGFRIIGLSHFFDNEAAGSAHGLQKDGLTPFGRQLVQRAQANHMLLDLAHASAQTIDDVLALSTAPVIVSHGGVQGTCDNQRNLSDAQVRGIAATGGAIGIGLFSTAVCGQTVDDTARSMRYVADRVGVDAVALGSDFDGAIAAPIDASGLPLLTEALKSRGFTAEEIAKIMGENALRILRQILPER